MVKIIGASIELLTITPDAELLIERAARTCYKSEHKITCDWKFGNSSCGGSGYAYSHLEGRPVECPECTERAGKFVRSLIERGHESTIEHASASFKVICDRGVTHEIVRHRLCSYSQESTRYCNYGKEQFGKEITVIAPPGLNVSQYTVWLTAMQEAEARYMLLIDTNVPAQIARSVLPNSLKTEIIWTANLREWRHIILLRTSMKAHPQMRDVAGMIRGILVHQCPNVFFDR